MLKFIIAALWLPGLIDINPDRIVITRRGWNVLAFVAVMAWYFTSGIPQKGF